MVRIPTGWLWMRNRQETRRINGQKQSLGGMYSSVWLTKMLHKKNNLTYTIAPHSTHTFAHFEHDKICLRPNCPHEFNPQYKLHTNTHLENKIPKFVFIYSSIQPKFPNLERIQLNSPLTHTSCDAIEHTSFASTTHSTKTQPLTYYSLSSPSHTQTSIRAISRNWLEWMVRRDIQCGTNFEFIDLAVRVV